MAYGDVSITEGSGADIAVDTIATKHFQRFKLAWGGEGSAVDVSLSNPMPVAQIATSWTHIVCANTTNAVRLKSAAGRVWGVTGFCAADYAVKICFHNVTTNPPVAGASVNFSEVCQAGQPINIQYSGGIEFTVGVGVTIVKVETSADLADSATTATVANDGLFNIGWS